MNSPAVPLSRAVAACLLAAGGALAAAPLTPAGGTAPPIAVTIYGDDDYPPYSYLENGEMKGIYTAIIRAALRKMPDYQVELQPVPWKRGLVKLETGESFALYPPYLRAAERPYMAYSEPIMAEQLVVYCNRPAIAGRALKHWPADYHGLRIGYNAGFLSGGKAFDEAVRAGLLSALPARNSRLNLLKLLKGRIDCYLNDRLSIVWELGKLRHEKLIEAGALDVEETAALSAEQGHLGYTMRDDGRFPYKQDFIRQFNAIIRDMKQDGEIRNTVERFLHGPG
ncbi:transporter substrate-binding domain-containing protein [Duganella sp. LX20W]|uniref:Transporter substrate-binding domain-containing protein n=1 Tax=Rugamonas brunnea TaxID=2758569 RepID=A0A7W2ESW9_9BURK|nr:transporter substrate-binding domain-containing protein [Rugamonas brunnea]MBA5637910.1 transporter substrate-binding domain-containing protein [Rugamonas brunnea]